MLRTRRPSHIPSTQAPSTPIATDGSVVVDSAWLESLRLRVHTLETTLQEHTASLADARAQLPDSSLGGGDLERARLVVEALRQRVSGDEEKESVLNRVEAALGRLSTSPRLHRPALPTPVAGSRAASAAQPPPPPPPPPPGVAPGAIPPAPPTAPHPAPLVDVPPPAAAPHSEAAPPRTVEPVPEEAVLPVPAPPVPSTPHGRRWRRRGAT